MRPIPQRCAILLSAAPFPASIISAFSASACRNLIGKVSSEITVIACLQLRPLPIFAGKSAAAIGRAAFAFHFVAVVVRHAPVMGQFFLGANIAQMPTKIMLPLRPRLASQEWLL